MGNNIGGLDVKITADDDDLGKGLNSAENKMKKFENNVSNLGKTLAAAFAVEKVLEYGKEIVNVTARYDSLKKGLTAVTGTAEKAELEFAKLQETAKLPGLGLEEAVQGSINLQAAGFSADTARRALEAYGNALATVGRGKADLDGVILALGQMASKGKISAEEINQIAERVPQIRQIIKDAFGTAASEDLQKLGISAQEFVSKTITELEKLPKVSGGVQNSLENLDDNFKALLNTIGQTAPIERFANFLSDAVSGLNQFLKSKAQLEKDDFANKINASSEATRKNVEELTKQFQANEKINESQARSKAIEAERKVIKDGIASREQDIINLKKQEVDLEAQLDNAVGNEKEQDRIIALGKEIQKSIAQKKESIKVQTEDLNVLNQLSGSTENFTRVNQESDKASKKLSDTFAKTIAQLTILENQQNALVDIGQGFNLGAEKAKVLESGIKSLIEQGLSPASVQVQTLINLFKDLGNVGKIDLIKSTPKSTPTTLPDTGGNPGAVTGIESQIEALARLSVAQQNDKTQKDAIIESSLVMQQVSAALTSQLQSLAVGLGEAFGTTLTAIFEGENGLKAALTGILKVVGQFAKEYGAKLIAIGIASNIALPGSGAGKIIGGGLLIAAGTALNAIKLATGTNYVPQDMLAYIHKGEAVVPKKYNPAIGSGSGIQVTGEFILDGTKLIAVIKNSTTLQTRRS